MRIRKSRLLYILYEKRKKKLERVRSWFEFSERLGEDRVVIQNIQNIQASLALLFVHRTMGYRIRVDSNKKNEKKRNSPVQLKKKERKSKVKANRELEVHVHANKTRKPPQTKGTDIIQTL